jgi:2-polyprenyl-3-methyl-5-hydroxy-6-metoxy-1,4-benzoquinol methylase
MSATRNLGDPVGTQTGEPAGNGAGGRDGQLTDRRYWENNWQQKDRGADPLNAARRYTVAVMDHVLRGRLEPSPTRRLLEVGCGTGRWLVYFHRTFGYAVTGCDYSEASCSLARRQLEEAGVPGTILQQDFFTLTGTYDVVRSGGLIEHFTDPKVVLEKFVSLLASGGTLITTVPNLAGLSGYYQRRWKPETFETHRVVALDELQRWYQGLGLRNVEARAFGSIIPERFPLQKLRSTHPRLYPLLSKVLFRLLLGGANRACLIAYRRFGWQLESPRFSPYLYAVGEKP